MLYKKQIAHTAMVVCALSLSICAAYAAAERPEQTASRQETNEVIIVGGGMAGGLHAYHVYMNDENATVIMYDKERSVADTTTANIVPSLTCDEILSVVPRGKALVEKMQIAFYEPGGIRVDDVANVNNSQAAQHFMEQAQVYSMDELGHQERTKTLLAMGKMSMDLWQKMYDEADAEMKAIMVAANFNPCHEPHSKNKMLHDGYRIDIIYNVADAAQRAQSMKADYESLGYKNCAILSPTEVMKLDPFLTDFCQNHATANADGVLEWNSDSIALWRPGGCLDAKIFLPKMYAYLKKMMGNRFQIVYGKEVCGVDLATRNGKTCVAGLKFNDGTCMCSNKSCKNSSYIFCPGESVGTLKKIGFKEPAFARFAGVSLMLNIPVPQEKLAEFSKFSHCMEVHQEGIVLAWQARFIDGNIFIGVAGTKAFYGDQQPTKDQAFAKNRNLLQLNMVNDVLPEFISLALGRDTTGQKLTQADMDMLEKKEIAKRWAGTRAVVFDGFPTLGVAYNDSGAKIDNAIITTHLGSGGASFGPAAVEVSWCANCDKAVRTAKNNPVVDSVLDFAQSNRSAKPVTATA